MKNKFIILVLAIVMCLSTAGCTTTDNRYDDSNITASENTPQTESVESDVTNTDDSQESGVESEDSNIESAEGGLRI